MTEELSKRERDAKHLGSIIEKLERANYRYGKIKKLQNVFVYSPLWRRLWIALFPGRHFK